MKRSARTASLEAYSAEYLRYLGVAKTARRSYAESVRILEAAGFRELGSFRTLKPGARVWRGCEDRTVMAAVIGRRSTPYGVTALVRRDTAPPGTALEPVSIEDLFVTMAKEGEI